MTPPQQMKIEMLFPEDGAGGEGVRCFLVMDRRNSKETLVFLHKKSFGFSWERQDIELCDCVLSSPRLNAHAEKQTLLVVVFTLNIEIFN